MTRQDDLVTESLKARGAALTIRGAAEACGVSHSTIKRKLDEFGSKYRDHEGTWRIPVTDLLGAGLKLQGRASVVEADPGLTQGHDRGGERG